MGTRHVGHGTNGDLMRNRGDSDSLNCMLPGGYIDDEGQVHREVELRPISGTEEEMLATKFEGSSAALATTVLVGCIQRLGTIPQIDEAVVRELLVEDRQFLLLKLRELTFGEQVQATIPCPWPNCGKKVDIEFSTKNIPIKEVEERRYNYSMQLSPNAANQMTEGETYKEIIFRLPNGADQEALSGLHAENEAKALSQLLQRCIQQIGPIKDPKTDVISRLSPQARREIESQMERVAPKVELNMDVICPVCSREFTAPFVLQEFFFGEAKASQELLYREVHYLAYHYHWSEREIMEMSRKKRQNYIGILADEMERMNNVV